MNRKEFLKKSIFAATAATVAPAVLKADSKKEENKQVGYNHLPNKEKKTMNTVLHKANTRGHADHGWLDTNHSFSFANYYNPERMNFGVLRVLNDDRVAAGRGFGTHPHDNMEIISIPLEGDLEHKDSMGNVGVIKQGDIQVMSAGTGIFHSEYNKNEDREVKFLQIWVFPNKRNVEPRYDQITMDENKAKNNFDQILSPNSDDAGVWIHQNAWFHLGNLESGFNDSYKMKDKSNGLYAFVIDGNVEIEGQKLGKRDGFGVWNTENVKISADSDARVLLMEVPMNI